MTIGGKPGIKTTEFYITIAIMVLGTLSQAGVFDREGIPAWVGLVVGTVLQVAGALGYKYTRTGAKAAEAAKEASITESRAKVIEATRDKPAAERAAALADLK